jgi:hypothetical protein
VEKVRKKRWEAELSVENRVALDPLINLEETTEEESDLDYRPVALE